MCEVKSHTTTKFHLNMKNRQNYQAVYQTNVVAHNNDNVSNKQKMYQTIDNMKAADTNANSTTVVEDLEAEDVYMEIMTIDHDDRFNASHAIKKDIDMRIFHTKTKLT